MTVPSDNPAIAGTASQSGADSQTYTPFSGVQITDSDNPDQLQNVTVTLSDPANGVLSNLDGGYYDPATGVYVISGTQASVTAALDSLVFTPTVGQVALGSSVTTDFAIAVNDGVSPAVTDATTSLSLASSGFSTTGPNLTFTGAGGPGAEQVTFVGTVLDAVAVTSVELYNKGVAMGAARVIDGGWTFTGFVSGEVAYGQITAVATDANGATATAIAPLAFQTGVGVGQDWVVSYDSQGEITAQDEFNSNGSLALGGSLVALAGGAGEMLFSTGASLVGQPYQSYGELYGDAANFSEPEGVIYNYAGTKADDYAEESVRYNPGGGGPVSATFTGVVGQPYTSFVYDYFNGVFSGASYTFSVPAGANYSGQEEDFDTSGALSAIIMSGVTGESYNRLELDYSGGVYQGEKVTWAVTGQAYTSLEVDVSAANVVTSERLSGFTSGYSSLFVAFAANGALSGAVFQFPTSANGLETAQNFYDGAGNLQEQYDIYWNGASSWISFEAGITLTCCGGAYYGVVGGDTFVIMSGPGPGQTSLPDFGSFISGANHDTLDCSGNFANAAAVLNATQDTSGGAMISLGNNTVLLNGVTKAQLAANTADLVFHS